MPPYLDPRDDVPRPDEAPLPVDDVPTKYPDAPLDWDDATRELPDMGSTTEPEPGPTIRPVDQVPSDAEIDLILDGPDPTKPPAEPSDVVPAADPAAAIDQASAAPPMPPPAAATAPMPPPAAAPVLPSEPVLPGDSVPPPAPLTPPKDLTQPEPPVPESAEVPSRPLPSGPLDQVSHTPTTPVGPVGPAAESIHPVPPMPTKPGFLRHLFGSLIGLLITPIGLVFAAWGGQLTLQTPSQIEPNVDWFGFGLIVLGALILGAVALLGCWSPAAPITGGLVWGLLLGSVYLIVPQLAWDTTASLFGASPPAFVRDLVTSGTSGLLLLVGVILIGSGIAAGLARRSGRIFGQAREVALRS